jgi:hypothetical protein
MLLEMHVGVSPGLLRCFHTNTDHGRERYKGEEMEKGVCSKKEQYERGRSIKGWMESRCEDGVGNGWTYALSIHETYT